MLRRLGNLPAGVDGVEALGKVSRDDYEKVLNPLLEEAHRNGRRVRFLYRLGPEFEGFTPGAAWEDFRLGLKYLRLFERCAVVTDKDWIRNAWQLMAPLLPCPSRNFSDAELSRAVEWLGSAEKPHHIIPKFLRDKEVLVVEVNGPLSREDFDAISAEVDPWIEKRHGLNGIVVHAKHFPGWENLGSFLRHVEFVGEHHRKIARVGLAADGILPEFLPKLANHFVNAEIKHFTYDNLDKAVEWAAEVKKRT